MCGWSGTRVGRRAAVGAVRGDARGDVAVGRRVKRRVGVLGEVLHVQGHEDERHGPITVPESVHGEFLHQQVALVVRPTAPPSPSTSRVYAPRGLAAAQRPGSTWPRMAQMKP